MPKVQDSSSAKNSPFPDCQSLIAGTEKIPTIRPAPRKSSLK